MEVGVALPQMAVGLDRARILAWCQGIDEGPFSSVSAGERIAFDNLDGFTLCNAAAALTERVRILLNVVVAPWHAPAMLAQELSSMDVLSGGRLSVALGAGAREQDFAALGSPWERRLGRLDETVAELRRLWAGGEAAGGGIVGPPPVQPGGVPLLGSATGPKSLARAARWADGISGFTIEGDAAEAAASFRAIEAAWASAGRTERPRHVTGVFAALGPDAEANLHAFALRYLDVFGAKAARYLADRTPINDEAKLRALIHALADEGCDELILVPASSDPTLLTRFAEVVTSVS